MDDSEDTDLRQTSARVAGLKSPADPYPESEQPYEPLRNDPCNAPLRFLHLRASSVARGTRGEPSGAVANPGYASSNVPDVRGYSQVVGQATQIVDMPCLAPVRQSHHGSEISPASPSGLKKDAPIQVAPHKKLTVYNQVLEYSFPPRKTIVKIGAQGKARTQRSREEQPFDSVGRKSNNTFQRIPQQSNYGVGNGGREVPFRADYDTHRNSVANKGNASLEVPVVQGYSHVVDGAAQVINILQHTHMHQATHWPVIRSPSPKNVNNDAPVGVGATKKLADSNHFPECSLPPSMAYVQTGAQDAARPYRSGNDHPFEPVTRETRKATRCNPQVGASGVGSGARGELSSSDHNVHRNSVANHSYASTEVPVVRSFSQDDCKAAQALLKLSHAPLEEDSRSAEIVPLSPSRMTTDAPIKMAPAMKLSIINQVAEISMPPRKVIDKRRARNPGQPPRSRGKKQNAVAPASTIRVRKVARLQRSGGVKRSAVEQAATPRLAPRTKTHYRRAGEGEDRPFKCTVTGCKSSFISNGHLQQHIRTVHEGERDYICKKVVLKSKEGGVMKWGLCDSGFASAFGLKQVCFAFYYSVAMTRMFPYSMRLRY